MAIKELEITYCIRVASLPKVALFLEIGIKSVKSSLQRICCRTSFFRHNNKTEKTRFLGETGFLNTLKVLRLIKF